MTLNNGQLVFNAFVFISTIIGTIETKSAEEVLGGVCCGPSLMELPGNKLRQVVEGQLCLDHLTRKVKAATTLVS